MRATAIASRRFYAFIMLATLAAACSQSTMVMTVALVIQVLIWITVLHAISLDIRKGGEDHEVASTRSKS